MIISITRIKKTVSALPEIFKKYAFLFIALHLVNFAFNQSMIYFQELRMTSHEDSYIPYMLAIAFVGFFVQSAIKVVWTFAVCHNFSSRGQGIGAYIQSHLEKGIIEFLRSFLKSVKWGFLFIIPGLIKAIRYQFVTFVICSNDKYSLGQVDALKTSDQLTRKHLLGLIGLFLFFGILSLSTSSSHLFLQKPLTVGFFELFNLVLFTFELTYMYFVFRDLQAEKKGIVAA